MNTLPNCKYCGKFVSPMLHNVVSETVYGFMGADCIIYYHQECAIAEKLKDSTNHTIFYSVEEIITELLLKDVEVDLMYPLESSSGEKLDGNDCRREAIKQYNKLIIDTITGNP